MKTELRKIHREIIHCIACPRLREYCEKIATTKRKAYLQDTYWGKPVTGFGSAEARLLIVGLAPAAHGANRTGRIFTGDRSGDWLYSALHHFGFANQPTSVAAADGLELIDTYITCTVKCAPPDNKPAPIEQRRCSHFLERELQAMPQARVLIALGQFALNALWPLVGEGTPKPKFEHGKEIRLPSQRHLLLSYHPSQQNTFTGRLTAPMFHSVFERARKLLS
jgi:uracil-DNA glycosylase family 4